MKDGKVGETLLFPSLTRASHEKSPREKRSRVQTVVSAFETENISAASFVSCVIVVNYNWRLEEERRFRYERALEPRARVKRELFSSYIRVTRVYTRIRSMVARAVAGRCHRRQLRPDRTQIIYDKRAACRPDAEPPLQQPATRCTWVRVALCKRAHRRHGAFRRGATVPRAQVELVSVRRTRLLPLGPDEQDGK